MGRRTSISASCPVEWKPPCSTSRNRSNSTSAVETAISVHRASPDASPRRVRPSTMAAWSAAKPRVWAPASACQARSHLPSSRRRVRHRKSPLARAASSQSSRPSVRAASDSVDSISPFHSVRTLSSSPGRIRCSRWANRLARTRSKSSGRSRSPRTGRWRILAPSKLPVSVTPYQAMAASARSGPRPLQTARISSADQT